MIKYLRYRLPIIVSVVLSLLVFSVIVWLYGLPVGSVFYSCLVVVICLLLLATVDMYAFIKQLKLIDEKKFELINPANCLEREYLSLLSQSKQDTLDVKNKALSDYNEMVEYFTLWAHQIKTPIAAISLTVQNLDDEKTKNVLRSEVVRTEEYVDMVLGYLRLGSETTDFLFETVDLSDVVRTEVRKLRTMFMCKNLGVDVDLSGSIYGVTDKRWLGFALAQILTNSVKYSNGGTIHIDITDNEIVVRDEGIGISPEDLPRIFDKGYTGYNGRSDKKSSGIGLYLVKKTMQSIGGDVLIESEQDVGTTATLVINREKNPTLQ